MLCAESWQQGNTSILIKSYVKLQLVSNGLKIWYITGETSCALRHLQKTKLFLSNEGEYQLENRLFMNFCKSQAHLCYVSILDIKGKRKMELLQAKKKRVICRTKQWMFLTNSYIFFTNINWFIEHKSNIKTQGLAWFSLSINFLLIFLTNKKIFGVPLDFFL